MRYKLWKISLNEVKYKSTTNWLFFRDNVLSDFNSSLFTVSLCFFFVKNWIKWFSFNLPSIFRLKIMIIVLTDFLWMHFYALILDFSSLRVWFLIKFDDSFDSWVILLFHNLIPNSFFHRCLFSFKFGVDIQMYFLKPF